jgi:dTDP-4-amino-4,6-dideoxygalactose transaminase
MRPNFLPFALPDLDETEFDALKECLSLGWITTGPKTKEFERLFAEAVGAKHAIAVNSCTAAMHLALEAIGLQRGDEVIIPAYTFAATAEVVRYFDATPKLVDVSPDSVNIDPAAIEAAITERTRAIIPVHMAGVPADMDAIAQIALRHNLAVIEDAAHAFPCSYRGRPIGSALFPDTSNHPPHFTCFSFYATKTITTGEGGMICTDDDQMADRCRIMALHGISRDAWKRYTAEGTWQYEIISPGYKYNLTDIASSLGLAQLAKSERMWERRREIAHRYNLVFGQYPSLEIPTKPEYCRHAWHLYMLRLHLDWFEISRSQFIDELKQRNIGASVHFIPLHVHPYYRDKYGYQPEDFPIAYGEYSREISLPLYSKMSDDDVDDVIAAVLDIVTKFATNIPTTSDEKTPGFTRRYVSVDRPRADIIVPMSSSEVV